MATSSEAATPLQAPLSYWCLGQHDSGPLHRGCGRLGGIAVTNLDAEPRHELRVSHLAAGMNVDAAAR